MFHPLGGGFGGGFSQGGVTGSFGGGFAAGAGVATGFGGFDPVEYLQEQAGKLMAPDEFKGSPMNDIYGSYRLYLDHFVTGGKQKSAETLYAEAVKGDYVPREIRVPAVAQPTGARRQRAVPKADEAPTTRLETDIFGKTTEVIAGQGVRRDISGRVIPRTTEQQLAAGELALAPFKVREELEAERERLLVAPAKRKLARERLETQLEKSGTEAKLAEDLASFIDKLPEDQAVWFTKEFMDVAKEKRKIDKEKGVQARFDVREKNKEKLIDIRHDIRTVEIQQAYDLALRNLTANNYDRALAVLAKAKQTLVTKLAAETRATVRAEIVADQKLLDEGTSRIMRYMLERGEDEGSAAYAKRVQGVTEQIVGERPKAKSKKEKQYESALSFIKANPFDPRIAAKRASDPDFDAWMKTQGL